MSQQISLVRQQLAPSSVSVQKQQQDSVRSVPLITKRKQEATVQPLQMEVTATKKVRVELDNVQSIVEKIRNEFDFYQSHNNDLRLQLFKKKKIIEGIESQSNELSTHVSLIGAKVSVNEAKFQKQLLEFDAFDKTLNDLSHLTISNRQLQSREAKNLLDEMFADISRLEEMQCSVKQSVHDVESRKNSIMTSFKAAEEDKKLLNCFCDECIDNIRTAKAKIQNSETKEIESNEALTLLGSENESIQIAIKQAEHDLVGNVRQVSDLESSLDVLQEESRKTVDDTTMLISDMQNNIQTFCEDVSLKKSHLKRLQSDIQTKMTDTHGLNRECDKATVSFAEQEHKLQEVSILLQSTIEKANGAKSKKIQKKEELLLAEESLKDITQIAKRSEQHLADRIESSKQSITSYFSLKKEVNEKEWEISKAKFTLDQTLKKQREVLAALLSQNLAKKVQLESEDQEKNEKKNQLRNTKGHLESIESQLKEKESQICELVVKGNHLSQEHGDILQSMDDLKVLYKQAVDEHRANEEAERSQLVLEASRLTSLIENLDEERRCDQEETAQKLSVEADKSVCADDNVFTADEIADIDQVIQRRFEEWQLCEEGQKIQQDHTIQLEQLQNQIDKLEGREGELFPQIVIDRNNEIAQLKGKISSEWDILKSNKFSELVSSIEMNLDQKSNISDKTTNNAVKGECNEQGDSPPDGNVIAADVKDYTSSDVKSKRRARSAVGMEKEDPFYLSSNTMCFPSQGVNLERIGGDKNPNQSRRKGGDGLFQNPAKQVSSRDSLSTSDAFKISCSKEGKKIKSNCNTSSSSRRFRKKKQKVQKSEAAPSLLSTPLAEPDDSSDWFFTEGW